MKITVGTRVRSFDFRGRDLTGDRACYVEGTVEAITEVRGCPRYDVRVERHVFGGIPLPEEDRNERVYPPVNGTPTSFGRVSDGVEAI
jgi:hypothetical protein